MINKKSKLLTIISGIALFAFVAFSNVVTAQQTTGKISGKITDNYNIEFFISPPNEGELGYHYDWVKEVNYPIIQPFSYLFKNLNFQKIINLKRR